MIREREKKRRRKEVVSLKEIVINAQYGGFSISLECARFMAKLGNKQAKAEISEWEKQEAAIQYFIKHGKWRIGVDHRYLEIEVKYGHAKFFGSGHSKKFNEGYPRDCPELIAAVKKLQKKANGEHASLKVVEIPNGVDWEIDEYDGMEYIPQYLDLNTLKKLIRSSLSDSLLKGQ